MRESRSHNAVANRLAGIYGTEYNKDKGVDVQTRHIAIEVETEKTIGEAGRQLQGHHKPVYVAVTTKKGVELAKERYEETGIGVMTAEGRIVKYSTRRW